MNRTQEENKMHKVEEEKKEKIRKIKEKMTESEDREGVKYRLGAECGAQ